MGLGPNRPKRHGQAIIVPIDDEQGKAHGEKPGLVDAFAAFLSQRIFLAAFGFFTAIAYHIENAILRRWQGIDGFLDPPFDHDMDISVSGIQQAVKAPGRDLSRSPASQLSQRFATGKESLHDDEPTQGQTMMVFPHTRHAAKQQSNKQGQVRDLDHNEPIDKGATGHSYRDVE